MNTENREASHAWGRGSIPLADGCRGATGIKGMDEHVRVEQDHGSRVVAWSSSQLMLGVRAAVASTASSCPGVGLGFGAGNTLASVGGGQDGGYVRGRVRVGQALSGSA